MACHEYDDLKHHVGHDIECVFYGDVNNPVNCSVECVTCYEVLMDFDNPDFEFKEEDDA